jgi:exopolysaccharide production protein ExoQ
MALWSLLERPSAIGQRSDAHALILSMVAALAPLIGALAPRGMAPLVVVGSVLGVAAYRLARRRWPEMDTAWPALTGAMIAYGAASLLWSPAPGEGLHQVWQFLYLLGPSLFLIASAAQSPRQSAAARILPFSYALGVLLLVARILVSVPASDLFGGRGTVSPEMVELNRNMVVMAALVWPAMLVPWTAARRGTALILPALLAIPVMASESQSAQLGLISGLLAFALAVFSTRLARLLLGVCTVFAFAIVVPAATWLNEKALDLQILPFSFRHRLEIWRFVAEHITDRPMLGWGLEASRQLGDHRMSDALGAGVELLPLHPHNAFLQIWLELGLVGAVPAAAVMLLILRCIGRLPAETQPPALAAFASAFAMITVSYGIWQSWWIGTIMITILLVVMATRPAGPGKGGKGAAPPPHRASDPAARLACRGRID